MTLIFQAFHLLKVAQYS